ncbi:choice-of-anchor D domain-containing protein [Ignavibacterium sp.]|uniref:choice-of-anchor D domain-containing protein n=1 Tax=Ignavibacterium sp. TaxID=2651167 RepID=UPI00307D6A3A
MRKLFSVLAMFILTMSLAYAQPDINIHMSFGDNGDIPALNTQIRFGLGTTMTNGIDFPWESDLPPFPPVGAFEARFDLTPFAGQPLGSYQDYRPVAGYPFSGTVEHRIIWQIGDGATSFFINYDLPAGVSILIRDELGGIIFNSGNLTGNGTFTITSPLTAARMFATYTNITPPGPQLTLSPPSLNFGPVAVGSSSAAQTVTVSNTGTANLTISNISSDNAQFTFTSAALPIVLSAGGSTTVNVVFSPTSLGNQSGNIIFTHDAPGSPTSLPVQGIGADAGPTFSVSPASVNFGNVSVGNTVTQNVTVSNNGLSNPLVISSAAASPGVFTVSPTSATIPPLGSQVFTVSFTPTAGGVANGTLTFTHNAPGSPNDVSLTGNGVAVFGLIFANDTVYNLEDSSYTEIMQLKSLSAKAQALQFRLLVNKSAGDNIFLTFQSIEKGTDVSDPSWVLQYNVFRGPLTSNGASVDSIYVLLYNLNQNGGLNPGDYNDLFKVKYRVADLPALLDTSKSTFKITNAEASTYQGFPIDITPSRNTLTVLATNRVRSYGDVNGDGFIDILDLIDVVDHIVGRDSLDAQEFVRADIAPWTIGAPDPSPDGFVNVQDLAVIQNIILTGFYPSGVQVNNKPTAQQDYLAKSNGDEEAKVILYLTTKGIAMHLDAKVAIRGAQIHFGQLPDNPGNINIDSELGGGYYFHQVDLLRVLMYDQAGQKYIEAGRNYLGNIPFSIQRPQDITIDKLILVSLDKRKLTNIKVEIIYGDAPLPYDYELFQNYPNPFNPSTSVMFTVPKNGLVTIKVYDMLGQEVTTLVNEIVDRGVYNVIWNGKNEQGAYVSSGNYIYRMVAGDFVKSRKMMLIK